MAVGLDADIVVVGAGPAGSTAARTLAERGVHVILLDRATFPRYKTCGGGIIGVTRACVPPGIPVSDDIYRASFTVGGSGFRTRESATPIMSTVTREDFDSWLLEQAIEEGAEFHPSTAVHSVSIGDSEVAVQTSNRGLLTARYVIDASGTNSRIAKQIGIELQTVDFGLELELLVPESESKWVNQIHLDWGPIPGSYGWLFPKGRTYTVGVIGQKKYGGQLRTYLADFSRQLGVDHLVLERSSGHQTRCRSSRSPLADRRVLFAGDAAGLMEPWTREGISFATRSGKYAGEVLALAATRQIREAAVPQVYVQRLEETLLPEMRAGFDALRAFERHPKVFHSLIASTPMGWKYFTRITTGDTSLARAMRHASVRTAVGLLNRF